MTIGIAFQCVDAIVMGADRQMTASGWNKYSETKLFYDATDERIIAMIGGDDLGLAKEVWWKLLEHEIHNHADYEQALKDILDGLGRLYTDLPLQLLCGLATKDGRSLLGFMGKGVYPIMEELGVICKGDSSLIRYLSKHVELFWRSNEDGITLAAYLLKRAEEFVDGCHGPMDVIMLTSGPNVQTFSSELIDELDRKLEKNHAKAFRDLLSLSPPSST